MALRYSTPSQRANNSQRGQINHDMTNKKVYYRVIEFSSHADQTHLDKLIKVFRITPALQIPERRKWRVNFQFKQHKEKSYQYITSQQEQKKNSYLSRQVNTEWQEFWLKWTKMVKSRASLFDLIHPIFSFYAFFMSIKCMRCYATMHFSWIQLGINIWYKLNSILSITKFQIWWTRFNL